MFEEGLGGGLERVFHNTKESRQKPARKSLLEPEAHPWIHSGALQKLSVSARVNKNWKLRYFVLEFDIEHHCTFLRYSQSEERSAEPLGSVPITGEVSISRITKTPVAAPKDACALFLVTWCKPGCSALQSLYCASPDLEERDRWIEMIQRCVDASKGDVVVDGHALLDEEEDLPTEGAAPSTPSPTNAGSDELAEGGVLPESVRRAGQAFAELRVRTELTRQLTRSAKVSLRNSM